jgi:hypothetical protein
LLFNQLQQLADTNSDPSLYDLYFYDPWNDTKELVVNGSSIQVRKDNLQEYIDLVLNYKFDESVRLQVQAFKKGFQKIMPVSCLQGFTY